MKDHRTKPMKQQERAVKVLKWLLTHVGARVDRAAIEHALVKELHLVNRLTHKDWIRYLQVQGWIVKVRGPGEFWDLSPPAEVGKVQAYAPFLEEEEEK